MTRTTSTSRCVHIQVTTKGDTVLEWQTCIWSFSSDSSEKLQFIIWGYILRDNSTDANINHSLLNQTTRLKSPYECKTITCVCVCLYCTSVNKGQCACYSGYFTGDSEEPEHGSTQTADVFFIRFLYGSNEPFDNRSTIIRRVTWRSLHHHHPKLNGSLWNKD